MSDLILDDKETSFDRTLRPKKLKDFVGQEKIKKGLKIFLAAAQKRKESVEHILFHGPPGLGKTTLAYIIAQELNVPIKTTSGSAIERVGDLAAILTSLSEHEILFFDEIHRLNRHLEEILYPAMEEGKVDLVIGKGPSAQVLRLDLPAFTLIGATTKFAALSSPMRERFGIVYRLNFYNEEEIKKIIRRSAEILGINIEEAAVSEIAKRSRFTPRIANRLLKRIKDFADVENKKKIDSVLAKKALDILEIDEIGLDDLDRKILEILADKFGGGPVGLNALSLALVEDKNTLEEICEPYLLQLGFINRTPKGRIITARGIRHLKNKNSKLF